MEGFKLWLESAMQNSADPCSNVEFAMRWPQHFLVMFDLPSRELPKDETAGENAFQTLLGLIIESQKEGALPEGDPHPLALMAWSIVHGIAKLAISGNLPYTSKQVLDFHSIRFAGVREGDGILKWRKVSACRRIGVSA
jgi:hypothetical protein